MTEFEHRSRAERGAVPRLSAISRTSARRAARSSAAHRARAARLPARRRRRSRASRKRALPRRSCSSSRRSKRSSSRTSWTPRTRSSTTSTDRAVLAGPAGVRARAAPRALAAERRLDGLVATARPADVSVRDGARRVGGAAREVLRGVGHARVGSRPERGRGRQRAADRGDPALRHEAARLLGFASFAEFRSRRKHGAHVAERVIEFLRDLARRSARRRRSESSRSSTRLRRPAARRLGRRASMRSGCAQQLLRLAEEELRPYFPLPRVLDGLFELAERLFDLTITERARAASGMRTCATYEIAAARRLARRQLLPRCSTRGRTSAAARGWTSCVGRAKLDGRLQRAGRLSRLQLQLPPGGDTPSLLTHDDVVTLFHEFGHGAAPLADRSRLSERSRASTASPGTRSSCRASSWRTSPGGRKCCADRAALPDRRAAAGGQASTRCIARAASTRASQMVRQLEFALFDFRLHAEYSPERGARVLEILDEVRARSGRRAGRPTGTASRTASHTSSRGGYAAGYYSYKWAEVLAADAFARLRGSRRVRPRHRASASCDAILARGGSRDALDAFIEFRGRPPELDALLRQSRHRCARRLRSEGRDLERQQLQGSSAHVLGGSTRELPDVLALQETKTQRRGLSGRRVRARGYSSIVQRPAGYNGVALVSRIEPADVVHGIGGVMSTSRGACSAHVRLACGSTACTCRTARAPSPTSTATSSAGSRRCAACSPWSSRAIRSSLVVGDFNVAPDDRDVYDPARMGRSGALHSGRARGARDRSRSSGCETRFASSISHRPSTAGGTIARACFAAIGGSGSTWCSRRVL